MIVRAGLRRADVAARPRASTARSYAFSPRSRGAPPRHGAARLDRNYGLSRDEHRRLLEAQNGVCAVCKLPSRRALCVDHCHATRQVRGLLCDKCNTALGLLGDDSGRMRAAGAYVDRARGSQRQRK